MTTKNVDYNKVIDNLITIEQTLDNKKALYLEDTILTQEEIDIIARSFATTIYGITGNINPDIMPIIRDAVIAELQTMF